ncbi:sugar transport protein [Penicillium cataractarum]|uniref:Sugar transport protein n=1 Tax=Penicillium cataractarum TaxID=2100454 RepID=A0A9W9V8U4_9EURO|nr:sugar transport protein [Penicillium cataractarum]KAJ5370675.1 sugar transport protein [Penicillium cataractarum]
MAFSRQTLSPMLILSTSLLVISAFNYGFSDQAFASCQAMDAFDRQFGFYNEKTGVWKRHPLFTSLYNSLKAGGQIIDVYLGMQMAVIPTTLTELAPAKVRGGMGVLYWLSIKVGGLVVTSITRGTSSMYSNAAWRIPFGLILVVPFMISWSIWFVPESPRWLLLRGRHSEALVSLTRLKPKNTPEESIQEEFEILSQKVAHQLEKKRFRDLFTPQNRQRTFVVVAANFFQQATGQAFASQYGTLFVKQLKSINAFSVTLGTNAVDIGAIAISGSLIDRVGRRAMFHVSSTMQTAALMTMGALGTAGSSNVSAKQGIVAMLVIYSFSWSLGWAPLVYVLGAELPSSPLREMTLQIAYFVKLITEYGFHPFHSLLFRHTMKNSTDIGFFRFAVTFSYPYMETADTPGHVYLGGKLGFIYGSLSAVAILFGFFFIPETSRLELEDIDRKFDTPTVDLLKSVEDQTDVEQPRVAEVHEQKN